jgi:hypothetical protein
MLDALAPVVAEYVPAKQLMHRAVPVTALYDPAGQAVHVPPFGPMNPRLHSQLVSAVDPATDCEFVGHAEHELSAAAPIAEEYLPAPQSAHTEAPVAEYLPAPQ